MHRTLPASLLVLLNACIVVDGGPMHTEEGAQTLDPGVTELHLDLDAGNVRLVEGEGEAIELSWTARYRGRAPEVEVSGFGDVARIEARCPSWSSSCAVDLEVSAPAGTWLGGRTGAGDVLAVGAFGGLELETGAGDVDVEDAFGSLILETGAGNLQVAGAPEELCVRTGAGDIAIDLEAVPGRVCAQTGVGDIELWLPGGAYDLRVEASVGQVDVHGITVDADAAAEVDLSTGAGDVAVHGW